MQMKKRIFSGRFLRYVSCLALTTMLIVCTVGIFMTEVGAETEEEPLTLSVGESVGVTGMTFTVELNISGNTGLTCLCVQLAYDPSLTLVSAQLSDTVPGGTFIEPPADKNPVALNWFSGTENYAFNGTFVTLTFTAPENVTTAYPVDFTVTFDQDDVYRVNQDHTEENVTLTVENGAAMIVPVLPGDTNMDGKVSPRDVTRLAQYLAGWDVDISLRAADVNADGTISPRDVTRMAQYIAGWEVELLPAPEPEPEVCPHTLREVTAVPASCTEPGRLAHWVCDECGRLFCDAEGTTETTAEAMILPATGHTPVVIPAVEPTCVTPGCTAGERCGQCNVILTAQTFLPIAGHTAVTIPGTPATCTENGITEGSSCSVCGTVLVPRVKIPALGHDFVNRVCQRCGTLYESKGLSFTSNLDGTCCVSGIGVCTEKDIFIPRVSPQGDTVTSIAYGAFGFCPGITSITIPDTVTSIGGYAFEYCTGLKSIVIPKSVTSIGLCPFWECYPMTIYCEASKKPSGWNASWNYYEFPVVWNYKGD